VPAGALILAIYWAVFGGEIGAFTWTFLALCALGGIGQILGTNLLIMSFDARGFAVGTAYSKTEAIQAAAIALLLLGEVIPALSWLGIAVSVAGVLVLSFAGRGVTPSALLAATLQRGALLGIAAGFAFAVCSIFIKAANIALPGEDPVLKALVCLVVINIIQTMLQGAWLVWREPAEVARVFATWRQSAQVGALSAAGSACWFSGFALAPVAMVRAVGQVEILFTLLASRFYLRERLRGSEVAGALIVVAGVVLVLLGKYGS
jgi:drug/metabolite transporter (DMT)-like permease